ncbi:MAG: helix-turn-helix domain-containing protein [Planctomycetes bacterium]|nr:helix-turn-helix domain-containing protein [Planctomycetota bacterium]
MSPVPRLATTGEVAHLLGEPVHRIQYILRTRNIMPRATAAGARCFDDEAIARIRYELHLVDARRAGGGR